MTAFLLLAAVCTALEQPPAAEIVWRVPGAVRVHADGDGVFVETKSELKKVELGSGKTIWTYGGFDQDFLPPEFVVLPNAVAVVREDRHIALLDRDTGDVQQTVDAGEWIRFLVGPPLVAVTQATDAETSTLVRISTDGRVTRTAVVPRVARVQIAGGVLVVEVDQESFENDLDAMTGYDLDTLQPLWVEASHTFNRQVIGGKLYVGDIFWSKGARAIDPKTGAVKAVVPPRDPSTIGGSGAFDLQVTESEWSGSWSPDFADCETLRRNHPTTGRTMWQRRLPLHVSATVRSGETLYAAGSHDDAHRYVVALDWSTGAIRRAWSGLPKLSELFEAGDLLLGFDLEGELVAIRR